MKQTTLLLFFLLLSFGINAQITITGNVSDETSGEALQGVFVHLSDQNFITETNEAGDFQLQINELPVLITIKYLGYEEQTITVETTEPLVIKLKPTPSILNTVVVTSSLFDKKIEDEPVSLEVIRPEFIERNAITSLENIMERTPGVQIVDGQVNIRSSGYAQGAGSRVGIYVDGQPMLSATTSNIQWNFVPIENVEQIEVVKGAASVLYGAAAMNGVINVRTAQPTSKPYTSIALYGGISDAPKEDYKNWWKQTNAPTPKNYGVLFAHRRKINKLDLVLGGNVHKNLSHIKDDNEDRYRFNIKTRYRITDRLTVGINGNWMRHSIPPYFLWQDGDTNILKPIDTLITNNWRNYSIDPHLTYFTKNNDKHTFNGRFFQTTFIRQNNDNTNAYVASGEYKYQKKWDKTTLIGGMQHQQIFSQSAGFRPDSLGNIGEGNASITAFFAQAEQQLLDDNKLTLIGGLRWEILKVGDYEKAFPIGRLSAAYKLQPKDIVRLSSGQGYRLPSLSERYIDQVILRVDNPFGIDLEGVQVIPNPNLRPERGWTTELGYKRLFDNKGWSGYIDAALFWMEYQDLANFVFDFHKDLDRPTTVADIINEPHLFGFSTVNVNRGRIAGFEISSHLNGKIGDLPFRFWGGYTYTYPANLDSLDNNNQSYIGNFFKAINLTDTTIIPSILTYRSLHVLKMDWEFYLKKFTLGFVANYNGFMHNIDPILEGKGEWGTLVKLVVGEDLLPGVIPFRAAHQNGDWVFDLRMGYQFTKQHQLNFIITNLLNSEYALRVGRINPLRTFNLKYQMTF